MKDLSFFQPGIDFARRTQEEFLKRSIQDVPDVFGALLITKTGIWIGGRQREHEFLEALSQLVKHSAGLTGSLARAVKTCPSIAQKLHLLAVALSPAQLDECLGAVIDSIMETTQ